MLARAKSRQHACKRVGAESTRIDREFEMFACTCHIAAGVAQRADRPASEIAQWRTLMAARRTTVKSFQSAFGRVLMQARVQTLKAIEQFHPDAFKSAAALAQKAAAAQLLFNLADFIVSFHGAMENQQKAALATAGQQLFDEMKRDDAFAYPPAKVLEYLRARQNKLTGVPQEVYDRVKASLEEGLNAGDTQAQLASRVKGIFNDIADGAAHTIAMTETSAAYGAGRAESMKQAGVQFKAWLTSGNGNVRASHLQAGLEYPYDRPIPVDDPFIVDGEALMYPGDDAGSAGNVINCHCVSVAVAAPK